MNKKTILLISFLLIPTIIITAGINYLYFSKKTSQLQQIIQELSDKTFENQEGKMSHPPCLADNEYFLVERLSPAPLVAGEIAEPTPISIVVKDVNYNQKTSSFQIEDVDYINNWMTKTLRCGVYVLRTFNYDYERKAELPDTQREVWHYTYDGVGRKIIEAFTFKIDESETYIASVKGGINEQVLSIEKLQAANRIYAITIKELIEKFPEIKPAMSMISLDDLNKNYLTFSLIAGSTGFELKIDINTKQIEVSRLTIF